LLKNISKKLKTGIVIKSTGSRYSVKSESEIFQCSIKGKFRISGIKTTNPVAVGDIVEFDISETENLGVIKKIHERKNYIIRRSVNLSYQAQIIAANIDEAVLLVTLINPKTYPEFIDRFLASCESYGIPAIIVFNKIDLYDAKTKAESEDLIKIYQNIGYSCFEISVKEKINLETIFEHLKGKTIVFSGNSGVGKSSLLNLLQPDYLQKTGNVSDSHGKGKHTTTFAEMFEFGDYRIIDTPGIKSFGLDDFKKEDVTGWFPEMFLLQKQCRFYNCTHVKEPGCAVKEAVDAGTVSASRYRSYLSILDEKDGKYREDLYKGL
jgi:ribosome biogenesis GTPase